MLSHPESRFRDARAVFVEARFRGRVVAARLLRARASRAFTIGAARRADAPVDPAFLPPDAPANDNHELVTTTGSGFALHLSPAMRAAVAWSAYGVRIPCGEVLFDVREAEVAPALPRPWFTRTSRAHVASTVGVGVALLAFVAILRALPSDPRALSLDTLARDARFDAVRVVPPVPPPSLGSASANGPARVDAREGAPPQSRAAPNRASRSTPRAHTAAAAVEAVRAAGILAILGQTRSAEVARIFDAGAALGPDTENVLENLRGGGDDLFAAGGLMGHGTGEHGADTGRRTIGGVIGLETGIKGGGSASRLGRLGALPKRVASTPDVIGCCASVRGGLDKELVRRVVRAHLNEVRTCYSDALARTPTLAGRVVVKFMIAATGRVVAAALDSSSLGAPAVESCIVAATKRWDYPAPTGGGFTSVSYPFQLVPVGE